MDQFHNIALIYPYLFFPIWCKNAFKKTHLYILCNNYFLKKILYSKILLFISLYCVKLSADHHLLLKIDHYYWNFVLLEHLRTIMSLFLGCSNGLMPFYQAFIFFFILCLISNKYFIKKKKVLDHSNAAQIFNLRQMRVFLIKKKV